MSYSTCVASTNVNFRRFFIISNFWKNLRWPPSLAMSQASAAPQPLIYTSPCRAHHRLSTECKIFSKHCNIKNPGGLHQLPTPLYKGRVWLCLYVRGLTQTGMRSKRNVAGAAITPIRDCKESSFSPHVSGNVRVVQINGKTLGEGVKKCKKCPFSPSLPLRVSMNEIVNSSGPCISYFQHAIWT